ncbi:hypothetical protein [Sporosarcina sp. HYO08]|uniref:hypothetical protein n=1 Tax=Sporosarcina sp. HYO08 TaxID=1759557 RepID=UPI00079BC7A7|nr:hypothetical protein [Sporosarcina sp. HYO08]KXH87303.1 hypothetical protein AU377_01640 [Sporosarcina sp. HYO08]
MKIRNSERGSALLIVLLLVVVFTLLGMSLLTMNISAAKQFKKKEERVQARHLAEMGVLHYKAEVEKIVEQAVSSNDEDIDSLKNNIVGISIPEVGYGYKVKRINSIYDNVEERLQIKIESLGEPISGTTRSKIEATIVINTKNGKDLDGKHSPPTRDDVLIIEKGFEIPKNGYGPINKDLHIKGNLTAVNGNHNTNLTVMNDLYIEGNIDINNHTCIVVDGDLTVLGSVPENISGKVYIVVNGNAYFHTGPGKINNASIFVQGNVTGNNLGDLDQYKVQPSKANCPNLINPKINWFVHPSVGPKYIEAERF